MLKVVPIVEVSRDHTSGAFDRRNIFAYHVPNNCNQQAYYNGVSGGSGSPNSISSSPLTQCFWTFFWLTVLLTVAYPIGLLSGQLYLLLSPLSAISQCRPLSVLLSVLLQGLHLPLHCTNKMAVAKPLIVL